MITEFKIKSSTKLSKVRSRRPIWRCGRRGRGPPSARSRQPRLAPAASPPSPRSQRARARARVHIVTVEPRARFPCLYKVTAAAAVQIFGVYCEKKGDDPASIRCAAIRGLLPALCSPSRRTRADYSPRRKAALVGRACWRRPPKIASPSVKLNPARPAPSQRAGASSPHGSAGSCSTAITSLQTRRSARCAAVVGPAPCARPARPGRRRRSNRRRLRAV